MCAFLCTRDSRTNVAKAVYFAVDAREMSDGGLCLFFLPVAVVRHPCETMLHHIAQNVAFLVLQGYWYVLLPKLRVRGVFAYGYLFSVMGNFWKFIPNLIHKEHRYWMYIRKLQFNSLNKLKCWFWAILPRLEFNKTQFFDTQSCLKVEFGLF